MGPVFQTMQLNSMQIDQYSLLEKPVETAGQYPLIVQSRPVSNLEICQHNFESCITKIKLIKSIIGWSAMAAQC